MKSVGNGERPARGAWVRGPTIENWVCIFVLRPSPTLFPFFDKRKDVFVAPSASLELLRETVGHYFLPSSVFTTTASSR